MNRMSTLSPIELIAYLSRTDACEPAMKWITEYVRGFPNATCEEIWDAVLAFHKFPSDEKVPKDTHVGRGWIAWLARHVLKVPCSNGTFSGMPKVNDGPAAEKLDKTESVARLTEIVRG